MKSRLLVQYAWALLLIAAFIFSGCKKDVISESTEDATTPVAADKKEDHLATARVPASETLQTLANGTFLIVNRKSGMVLDVASASTANNANVLQWGATGGTNQRWTLTQLSGGYYSIIGVPSGRALQVYQSGTA
ncbi:MAG TPA: RICIN domain-containing protein, partial [Niastella sp.]